MDLETGTVLAVTLEGVGASDAGTLAETVMEAAEQLARVATNPQANQQLAAGGLPVGRG